MHALVGSEVKQEVTFQVLVEPPFTTFAYRGP